MFCTGAGMSGRLGFGLDALDELGVRLVAPDRPGLGRSDPHPGKTLASFAQDVNQWKERLGLENAVAVGFSQGAPFAVALAGHGVVRALALVAPQDDLGHASLAARLAPDVAALVRQVRADPDGVERQFASFADAEGMWQLIVGMSGQVDRAVYVEEPFATAWREALREGFARGAAGYARDLVLALGLWPIAPEDVRVPVDVWCGALDASPVHSPDAGASLASRFPFGVRHVDPDAGGAILWTRGRDILAHLLARAQAADETPEAS